jgi:hypothetical protein
LAEKEFAAIRGVAGVGLGCMARVRDGLIFALNYWVACLSLFFCLFWAKRTFLHEIRLVFQFLGPMGGFQYW